MAAVQDVDSRDEPHENQAQLHMDSRRCGDLVVRSSSAGAIHFHYQQRWLAQYATTAFARREKLPAFRAMRIKASLLSLILVFLTGIFQIAAQQPIIITSFSQDGVLVCSNLNPGSVAALQWACSLAGPWQTNWTEPVNLSAITVDSNGTCIVSVPISADAALFYRVFGVAATNSASATNVAGMALIPAGSFMMGDTLDGETDAVPTIVYVSQFYMETNAVTYGLWVMVYSNAVSQGYEFDNYGSCKTLDHPVETVDWWDCLKWCNARSQQEGLTPVYYTDPDMTQVYTNGQLSPYANWSANGYRLPTEAEWEKAARGGLSGQRFPWGDTISQSQANYYSAPGYFSYDSGPYSGFNGDFFSGIYYPYTSPVGCFAPNGYGLYDMAGNVFEWVWDWYGTPYGQPSTNNPTGPATGNFKAYRGSSWISYASSARCASRNYTDNPLDADMFLGFRCVRAH
jgi:formylglycine-generating enzyme